MKKIIAFLLLVIANGYGQKQLDFDKVPEAFEAYSQLPREVVYVHLNKSTYIKGEYIGFKAYVFDKGEKKLSNETKNLYCTIADEQNRIIKKQLIKIDNGIGDGLIRVDSLFNTADYSIKAYTNWMRNFTEPNYFEQIISVVDPETDPEIKAEEQQLKIDTQFLPEGGHAVAGLEAVFGVIIKDQNGFGLPFIKGTVVDGNGDFVTTFKTNNFGIGRLGFLTANNKSYSAKFNYLNKEYIFPINDIENQGIVVKLQDLKNKVGLTFRAQFRDKKLLREAYLLTIHNGDSLKAIDLQFNRESAEIIKVFPKENLFPGINVITLFTPEGKPVLERLFFNEVGIDLRSDLKCQVIQKQDSLYLSLSALKEIMPNKWSSLSVSILPESTESYKAHHSLPSYQLLNPYVKGPIENAAYYFKDMSPKKSFELDNLLITQGWSSYDWNTIFTQAPKYLYDFEKGLTYKVTLNSRKGNEYYIFPSYHHKSQILSLEKEKNSFSVDEYYPVEGEKLGIAELSNSGESKPAKVFIQFKPSSIPDFQLRRVSLLPNKKPQILNFMEVPMSFEKIEKLQQLDEVVILKDRTKTRIEKLANSTAGKIDFFKPNDPRRNQFLSNYLGTRGFLVNEYAGDFFIAARNPNTPNNTRPAIYLDGVLLTDFNILYRFRMDLVDYIEINASGVGNGLFGGGGVIKIVTDPFRRVENFGGESYVDYDIPLVFNKKKRFYNPSYQSYNSNFFNTYGTIDWQPNVSFNTNGEAVLQIKDYGIPKLKLFVEGIVNDSEYVSETLVINLD